MFDLKYIYGDPESPTELTVFSPKSEELTASWITVDRGNTASLDDIAWALDWRRFYFSIN